MKTLCMWQFRVQEKKTFKTNQLANQPELRCQVTMFCSSRKSEKICLKSVKTVFIWCLCKSSAPICAKFLFATICYTDHLYSQQVNFEETMKGLLQVLKDFALGTSIAGLKYLAQPSLVTRVVWAIIITFALIFAGIDLNKAVVCKFKWFMLSLENKSNSSFFQFIFEFLTCPFNATRSKKFLIASLLQESQILWFWEPLIPRQLFEVIHFTKPPSPINYALTYLLFPKGD